MSDTQAEPSVRERIEAALEAGATSALFTHPRDCNMWKRSEALAMACHPDNIRALLAEHDALTQSQRAEIERLREALEILAGTLEVFVTDGSAALDSVIGKNVKLARAALTKPEQE